MTQTIENQDFESQQDSKDYHGYFKDQSKYKALVLDYLFRNMSFVTKKEEIRAFTDQEYRKISSDLGVSKVLINVIISRFLVDLAHIKEFLKSNGNVLFPCRNKSPKSTALNLRLHLHKLHRLAPIFDYKRARKNVDILRLKLNYLCFWPQVMTQVAIIIFATDMLDKSVHAHLIQINLRMLCDCSAFAFHRTRNKLGLNFKKKFYYEMTGKRNTKDEGNK